MAEACVSKCIGRQRLWVWPVQSVAEKLGACVAEAEHSSVSGLLQRLQVISYIHPGLRVPHDTHDFVTPLPSLIMIASEGRVLPPVQQQHVLTESLQTLPL